MVWTFVSSTYGITSSSLSVLASTLSMKRFRMTSSILSSEPPGDAVRPSMSWSSACFTYCRAISV